MISEEEGEPLKVLIGFVGEWSEVLARIVGEEVNKMMK